MQTLDLAAYPQVLVNNINYAKQGGAMSNEEMVFRTFTEDNPNFALVVDGEVATNFSFPSMDPLPETIEGLIAIFKSSPTIIKTFEFIEPGSTWDGSEFTPPA